MLFVQSILGMETELKRAGIIYGVAESALETKNIVQLNTVLKHLDPIINSKLLSEEYKKRAQDLFNQITFILEVLQEIASSKVMLKDAIMRLESKHDADNITLAYEAISDYQHLMESDRVPAEDKKSWEPIYHQYCYIFAHHLSINNETHEYDDEILKLLVPVLQNISLEELNKVKVKALSLSVSILRQKEGCTESERFSFKRYLERLMEQNISYVAKIDSLIILYVLNIDNESYAEWLQKRVQSTDFFDAIVNALCITAQEYFKASKQASFLPPEIMKDAAHLAGIRLDQLLSILCGLRGNPIEVGQQLFGDLSSMSSLFIENDTQGITLGLIQRLLSASHVMLQAGESRIVESLLKFLEPSVNALSGKKIEHYALKTDFICFKETVIGAEGSDTRRLHALQAFEDFITSDTSRTSAEKNRYLIGNYWNQARILRIKKNAEKAKKLIKYCIKNTQGIEKLKSYLELGLVFLDEKNFEKILIVVSHAIAQTNKHGYRDDEMLNVMLNLYFELEEVSRELSNSLAQIFIEYAEYHFNYQRYGKSIEYASIIVDEMEESDLDVKARAIAGLSSCLLRKYSEGVAYLQPVQEQLHSLKNLSYRVKKHKIPFLKNGNFCLFFAGNKKHAKTLNFVLKGHRADRPGTYNLQ